MLSDLREAEKDQRAKRSLLEVLFETSISYTSTMLLIGDSVIRFVNPTKMAPQDENLQKICVPDVTVTDLCYWLSRAAASHTINYVILHVGVNSCAIDRVSEAAWSDMIPCAVRSFHKPLSARAGTISTMP